MTAPSTDCSRPPTARALCLGFALLVLIHAALYLHLYCRLSRLERRVLLTRVRRDTTDNAVLKEEPKVEFFNPKLRQELEEKDKAQNVSNGDPWVWLTSYSRIPLSAIQGFCMETKTYCPAGLPGPAGRPGETGRRGEQGMKGERGARGPPGEAGPPGPVGPTGSLGPKGPRGEPGPQGQAGLDGRDGVPGEPGLDGMPGRNGRDGLPGLAGSPGTPGTNGIPGTSGKHGINGTNGARGPPGQEGPVGPRGMTGPRGRTGRSGLNGTPGIPAVCLWQVTVNGTNSSEFLIPPAIIGSESMFSSGPIVVKEGDNVRLRCAATGFPPPLVEWRQLSPSNRISHGKWHGNSIPGNSLNLTRVSRHQMGMYMCIASNGIPPPANQSFLLEVHFPPFITIQYPTVYAHLESTINLQCLVEAFPDAVKYWERDGKPIENSEKYNITYSDLGTYKFRMDLSISKMSKTDNGTYYCWTKNEMGSTKGTLLVIELPAGMRAPAVKEAVFGREPARLDTEESCPPPPRCQDCPDCPKCRQGKYSLYDLLDDKDLDIRPLDANRTYPGLPNRKIDCQVYAVGKPVYHRHTDAVYGSWMRDPCPRTEPEADKYWLTKEDENNILYEFANKTAYRENRTTSSYALEYPFSGNAHLVYNGSFFYYTRKGPYIVKYELSNKRSISIKVPHLSANESEYLYTTAHNFMDFSVDDNGLWIIYGLSGSNNTAVIKMDAYRLEIQFAWNISLKHQKAGEMFIVCGVLYVVDSTMDRTTKIRFALDLYKNHLLEDVNIEFTNPFRRTTMIGYNPKNKELYTWDRGNQLTYPIRYHELNNSTMGEEKGEPEALRTGFVVEEPTQDIQFRLT